MLITSLLEAIKCSSELGPFLSETGREYSCPGNTNATQWEIHFLFDFVGEITPSPFLSAAMKGVNETWLLGFVFKVSFHYTQRSKNALSNLSASTLWGVSVGKTVLVTLVEAWQSHNCLISRLKGQDAHRGLKLERRAILGWKLHGSVFRCWSPSFGLSLKWMFQFINTSEAATEPAVLHKGRFPWW